MLACIGDTIFPKLNVVMNKRLNVLINRWIKKLGKEGKTITPDQNEQVSNRQKSSAKKESQAGKDKRNNRRQPRAKKPSQPAWDISMFDVPVVEDKTRFHDLGLPDVLMHAIQDLGFEYCSPIQSQVLPHALQGHDAIGKAQTGTGKTAAFLITMIEDFIRNPVEAERFLGEPRALIIAPTRELVMQIADDAVKLCKYSGLHVQALIGGADYHKQKQNMEKALIDIVVATPGRLIDFMTRGDIYLDRVESLVLDEADRMLDMGFIPQVKRVVRATPSTEQRQTQLFSATFTQDIFNLAEQWTHKPIRIEIEPDHIATESVDQKVYMVSSEEKLRVMLNILRQSDVNQVIIFGNRRDQTRHLYEKIRKGGFHAGILSGEIPQNKRTRTLDEFKKGNLKVLVATDVAGRGIHVDGVSHVVNYNLPEDPEDYVHRIGRTGRAGASGTSISLACEDEAFQLPAIEELLGEKLTCEFAPQELLN